MHAYMCVCIYIYIYIYVCVYVCIYIYIYMLSTTIYIYIYIYIYRCVYVRTPDGQPIGMTLIRTDIGCADSQVSGVPVGCACDIIRHMTYDI